MFVIFILIVIIVSEEYWPEFVYRLGVPLPDTSYKRTTDHTHNLALLKRWLDLQETRAMDEVNIKVLLVQALNAADPALMANEIATVLNIDFAGEHSVVKNLSLLHLYFCKVSELEMLTS